MTADAGLTCALSGRIGDVDLDVAFDAPPGVVTALTGESASGKTTLLRALAGLHRLRGRVSLGEEVWQDDHRFSPIHKRGVGFVFQEGGLLPHLSVAQNLGYAAKRSGAPADSVSRTVALLGLEGLTHRGIASLSGGERRRVAVARALLVKPRLLLLDEPFTGLDAAGKAALAPHLAQAFAGLNIPILLVSHDVAEVDRLAARRLVLHGGRIREAPV